MNKKHSSMGSKEKGGGKSADRQVGHGGQPGTKHVPGKNSGQKVQMDGETDHGGGGGAKGANRYERALGLSDPYGDSRDKDLHAGRPKNAPQYNHE